jgi:hypothetical protein
MAKRTSGGKASAPAKPAPSKKPEKKAKKRGKADAATPMPGYPGDERQTISTRKIGNGYVTTQSSYRKGKFSERETYTPGKPKIELKVTAAKDRV